MKKLINNPASLVLEMCSGIVHSNPSLSFDPKYRFIAKKELNPGKVTLISGGGSGHEPAHAGFVGKGMLDAAVCGDVFASPSQVQVYKAIKHASSEKGVLLIIKNYSGDIMNFKSAAKMAAEDGINVMSVQVNDDIAVKDSLYTVGRRGVAGTVFVHKIAGAAAEEGKDLAEVKRIAQKAVDNTKSIGFALSSCTVPATGIPSFTLAGNEIEYGIGIHGEPGIKRESIQPSYELAKRSVELLLPELNIGAEDKIAVLINGFGATPLMELYLFNNDVQKILNGKNIKTVRSFTGEFMTSIDMAGASVSIIKLDDELEHYLNMPCITPGFNVAGPENQPEYIDYGVKNEENNEKQADLPVNYAVIGDHITYENMQFLVSEMCRSAIKNEEAFCEIDSHAGDGDFGTSIANGLREVKRQWSGITGRSCDISSFLDEVSLVIMEYCGGASGPIWGAAFRSAAKSVTGKTELSVKDFADMLEAAAAGVYDMGEWAFGRGAQVGDKTLMDALVPAVKSWQESAQTNAGFISAFKEAAKEAVKGAKKTGDIVARMGRAGVVGTRSLGYPDAGAHGLAVIFTEIAEAVG